MTEGARAFQAQHQTSHEAVEDVVASYPDLYAVLGFGVVPSGAESEISDADIRRAFKLRARQVHPDKAGDHPRANEAFLHTRRAYEILATSSKRAVYDVEPNSGFSLFGGSSFRAAASPGGDGGAAKQSKPLSPAQTAQLRRHRTERLTAVESHEKWTAMGADGEPSSGAFNAGSEDGVPGNVSAPMFVVFVAAGIIFVAVDAFTKGLVDAVMGASEAYAVEHLRRAWKRDTKGVDPSTTDGAPRPWQDEERRRDAMERTFRGLVARLLAVALFIVAFVALVAAPVATFTLDASGASVLRNPAPRGDGATRLTVPPSLETSRFVAAPNLRSWRAARVWEALGVGTASVPVRSENAERLEHTQVTVQLTRLPDASSDAVLRTDAMVNNALRMRTAEGPSVALPSAARARYAFNATGSDGLDARSLRRVAGRLIRRHLWQDQVERSYAARKSAQV